MISLLGFSLFPRMLTKQGNISIDWFARKDITKDADERQAYRRICGMGVGLPWLFLVP
jgi:hypothetical protein